ncbi:hypothetical protein PV379_17350 [Streptomyces caniscabiei]|uniref:hypothetical protein n=1 Tax=Streptomyces caniscabiei TaxID=2746961 RepID=UPI0029BD6713|nr:hypothetical protein [Streptomyces caniscabiei]MDX2605995.1 hypothetical protein [Streptomyces caniscabiei]MDX2735378.1 hypothetical protein [Streptomyces caniscabiei]MDX2779071.1 hypothetical protein [Streptomyces caniscabiei]
MTAADPHPFSATEEPALAVRDERSGLLAVAGRRGHDVPVPVAVHDTSDLRCRVLVHSRFPVHAMAFHPLIEHEIGRQVLELEWVDEHALRVVMAPPDDWQDERARVEGHVVVVHRDDWAAVPARSLTGRDLAGPRVPAPRPDGREAARQLLAEAGAARRAQRADHSADL